MEQFDRAEWSSGSAHIAPVLFNDSTGIKFAFMTEADKIAQAECENPKRRLRLSAGAS